MAAAAPPITEVDITALLQPRQGYLWKLGGGQETGSKSDLPRTTPDRPPPSPLALQPLALQPGL